MKFKVLILLIFSLNVAFSQSAEIVKFDKLKQLLDSPSDQIQVINFWATWCAPCVKELPLFESFGQRNKNVQITLINLDFAEKIERVNSFIKHKNIKSCVLLLDEMDYNSWIDKVDPEWSGAIPGTLVINSKNGRRKFFEKELQEGDLEKLIKDVQ